MLIKDYQSPDLKKFVFLSHGGVICASSNYDSDNGTEIFIKEDIEEL